MKRQGNPKDLVANESKCLKCGAPLTREAREGVCPKCLLEQAMGAEIEESIMDSAIFLPLESSWPRTQDQCFGDYQLLEEIARGGMGVVYKARQLSLNRIVAIKMILAHRLATREFVHRFRVEAAAAAALQHPNIVAIHEVGVHEGQHFFSMDYVAGRNLAQVARDGALSPRHAARYVRVLADAIDYAHEQGILHRDLKPSNILIDAEDQPRITDFGLAKRLVADPQSSALTPQLTVTGQALGSPGYMPPEQVHPKKGKVGRASDVYAMGAILYELMTGRPPFRGETQLDTIKLALETEPITPRLLNPKIPLDLETIALKCLRKDPLRRYATARELAEDLGRFLAGRPIVARPVSAPTKLWRWCRRRPAVAGLGAAVGLLMLAIIAGSVFAAWQFKIKEAETRSALWDSYLSQAHLQRASGEVGQRFDTLATLAKASAIKPSPKLGDEAIGAMALPDLREIDRIPCPTGATIRFDAILGRYAQFDRFGSNGFLSVCRAVDGSEVAHLPMARSDALFHLSPRGRFVGMTFPLTETEASCQLWEVAGSEMIFEATIPTRGFAAEFDGRGRVALGQLDGRVLLHDLDGRQAIAWYPAGLAATCLRFSPDGHFLAVTRVNAHEVIVLDLSQNGRVVAQLETSGAVFDGLDWSEDGSRLAVNCQQDDGSGVVQIWAWDAGRAKELLLLRGHQNPITVVRFLPHSEFLLTMSYDGTTRFWSKDTGRQVLVTHLRLVMNDVLTNRLAFQVSPTESSIQEFVADREFRAFPGQLNGGPFRGIDLSPDGKLLAIPVAKGVDLWDAASRVPLTRLPGAPLAVAFHPSNESLATAESDRILRWPMSRSARDGSLAVGAPEILRLSGPHSTKFLFCFSRDGSKLAWANGTVAEVLDWRDPARRFVLDHALTLDHVNLNADATQAVTSGSGFKVWDLPSRKIVFTLARLGQSYSSFSPDNRWVVLSSLPVSGVGGGVHSIYEVGSWRRPVQEVVMDHGPWPISAFTPDGRLLALRVTQSAIRLFDTSSWSVIATVEAPTRDTFSSFTFSRDGAQLAVACDNHSAQLWDLGALRQQLAALGLDWNLP